MTNYYQFLVTTALFKYRFIRKVDDNIEEPLHMDINDRFHEYFIVGFYYLCMILYIQVVSLGKDSKSSCYERTFYN